MCLVCHEKMWGNHKCRGFTKRNIERTDDIHTKGDVAEWRCLLYIVAKWPKVCLVCHEKIWENQRKGRGLTKRNIERTEDIHTKGDVAKWRCLLYVCIEYSAVCKHMHSLIYLYVFPAFSIRQICMLLAEEFAVTSYMMSDWVHMQPTLLSCVPISVNVNMYICVYVNVGSQTPPLWLCWNPTPPCFDLLFDLWHLTCPLNQLHSHLSFETPHWRPVRHVFTSPLNQLHSHLSFKTSHWTIPPSHPVNEM